MATKQKGQRRSAIKPQAQREAMHTPTPWKRKYDWMNIKICADGGRYTIAILSDGKDDPKTEANVDFILRAVNAHDDLIAILKQVRDDVREYGEDDNYDHQKFYERMNANADDIDDALRRASHTGKAGKGEV